ncbi:GBF-interacting protein 1-like [Melia azedarach]|uniref:GBF-interacting protein 1-like n=1 Tax=Melia azedarach TaxID=155640 RepID=A0ACC1WXA3_MELAZ|nr:GBF-interacting protein 1-like [Melia azedarach]
MSGKGGGGGGVAKGNNGISSIPAGSRKIVQSLREIVNCSETEIYAMLKDCNMDPNEAVNRLLSQDPFHEVKSKRDKRKENKDTTDYRSRAGNTSNRGGRVGTDRYGGRGGSSHFSSNGSSFSASGTVANNMNRRSPSHSDAVATESKTLMVPSGDGIPSSSQPSSGFPSAWLGVPGQVSMADIVKMGRPQNKALPHQSVNNRHVVAPPSAVAHHDLHPSQGHPKASELSSEPEVATSQHAPPNDEWPSIEQPPTVSSILEGPANSELYASQPNLSMDRTEQQRQSQLDEVDEEEDSSDETPSANHVGSASVSSRNIQEDNSGGSSLFENNLYNNMSPYQPHRHAFEHDEAQDGASSVTEKLQQLNFQNDDRGAPAEEDNPSVIIPNHLQVHTPDCSHLSFGSFGSGIGSTFPASFASRPLKNNLEETSETADAPSIGHSDTRNPEFYGDEHLRSASDANIAHRPNVTSGDYDSPSVSQPSEVLKQETAEAMQENQYSFPSSASGYSYESAQQLNTAFAHPQASSQMQNLAPFSNVMAYTNSLPTTLLASTVQTAREPDLQYSPFPVTQSMPTKYSNTASSISGPTMSMPEALRASSISAPQPTPQTMPGASVATGPALPPHLAVHPYSQPTLPLGHFANMIGYPFLPQSYTYMPSAFQQTFAGNSTYHQSLAAVLPQYKNSVSVSSLPQSAAVASGYGFGSSTSIPGGNFPLNTPAAPAGTTIGYDDVLGSQYKDNNHLISLQQNDNSAMWVHGPGSRTMSSCSSQHILQLSGAESATWWVPARSAAITAFWGTWVPKFLPLADRNVSGTPTAKPSRCISSGWISSTTIQTDPATMAK